MKASEIKIGETYNYIRIIGDMGRVSHSRRYKCLCTLCGSAFEIDAQKVGQTTSCRSCAGVLNRKNLSGQRFGRLVATMFEGIQNGVTLWRCKCDCGKETVIRYSHLISGITKSCGCLSRENHSRIGLRSRKSASETFEKVKTHPLYSTWGNIMTRCYNRNNPAYVDYGGRGIKVCDRWLDENGFENFVNDMGERPSPKHSIDRIDVNGDYCPDNCRWATQKEQCNNKRSNVSISISDKQISLTRLCEMNGFNYDFCKYHIRHGVDINIVISCCLRLKYEKMKRRFQLMEYRNFNRVVSEEIIDKLKIERND